MATQTEPSLSNEDAELDFGPSIGYRGQRMPNFRRGRLNNGVSNQRSTTRTWE